VAVRTDGEEVHDPVVGYRLRLERQGDNLVVNALLEPGSGTPPHVHPNGEEHFSLEEGSVQYRIGRRKVIAAPGDELLVPRGTRHSFKNVGDAQAVFRAAVVPERSGKGEGFFRESAAAAQRGMYTKRGLPTGPRAALQMLDILERYQDFIVVSPQLVNRILISLTRPIRHRDRD
jgi:quercetin dioxygenase-like cupin family protein